MSFFHHAGKVRTVMILDNFFSWISFLGRLRLHMCGLASFTHTHTHTDYILLSLDGVHWSHVITGNVATATSGERASIPPVPFTESERERQRGKRRNRRSTLIHIISYELTSSVPLNTSKYSFSLTCSQTPSMKNISKAEGNIVEHTF